MKLNEIQDLIKFVSKSGVSEVELETKEVKIVIKTGNGYSSTYLDVDKQSSADGSYIKCPENCIFELKYPETDIVGTIL